MQARHFYYRNLIICMLGPFRGNDPMCSFNGGSLMSFRGWISNGGRRCRVGGSAGSERSGTSCRGGVCVELSCV